MKPRLVRAIRVGVPAGVLAVLVVGLGTEPFLAALEQVTPRAVAAAVAVTALTTVCSAWRWSYVARRLGLRLAVRHAVPAYYRSQLLNQVLPGGVLGDVHRAVRHGADQSALGPAARAVAWDRIAGQVGLGVVAVAAVVWLPGEVRHGLRWAGLAALGLVTLLVSLALGLRGSRAGTAVAADLRRLWSGGAAWIPVLLSVLIACGHLTVLLVALRAGRADLPLRTAVPLLLVVLLASSLPLSLAGWGPREGAAAWVFGAAGLGAGAGVTVTTLYAVLSLAAAAPGALVLLHDVVPRRLPKEVSA